MSNDAARNIRIPEKGLDYRMYCMYIERDPAPPYHHASEAAHEAFRDMKFGVRIHWGLYSIQELQHESWPFLKLSFAERQAYNHLYETWNPVGFNAEEWMKFFQNAGFKCLAFTTKHHEGFSMFDTQTRVKKGSIGWFLVVRNWKTVI